MLYVFFQMGSIQNVVALAQNQVIQRCPKYLRNLNHQIDRAALFTGFNATDVAVGDIQKFSQFYLVELFRQAQLTNPRSAGLCVVIRKKPP